MGNPLFQNRQNNNSNSVSFDDFIGKYKQFTENPMQVLSGFGVPQNVQNPSEIIQYLMNTGKLSQQQFAQIQQMANQIKKSPMFKNAIKK